MFYAVKKGCTFSIEVMQENRRGLQVKNSENWNGDERQRNPKNRVAY